MIGRRQFMANIGGLCLGLVFAKTGAAWYQQDVVPAVDYSPYLIAVINDHCRHYDCEVDEDEKRGIAYACGMIMPTTHAQIAVTVALSRSYIANKHLVDEYVRRRNGMEPLLDDHPLLDLPKWGMPSTYRIMLYREQLLALIQELTGNRSRRYLEQCLYQYVAHLNTTSIRELATHEIQERIADEEFCTFDRILRHYAGATLPYAYCSTLADRAEAIMRADIGKCRL